MRKFIFKIITLSLPLIIFMVITDIYISSTLKNSHKSPGEMEVWDDIYNGNINSEIAIYGSSRAWVHFDPRILENLLDRSFYNLGIDGHNFWLQYLRHKVYLKNNKPPKIIIISVDIYTLQKRKNLYNLEQFLPYMLWDKTIYRYTSSYDGFTYLDYFIPFIRYSGKIRSSLTNSSLNNPIEKSFRYKGYRGLERDWNNDLEKAKQKMRKYVAYLDIKSIELFDQFLQECKNKNIKVILVYTPEYFEGQKFVKNRVDVINKFNGFSKKYNLLFLDYSKDTLCYQKEYFYNALHLNKRGAEIFTKKLGSDLNNKL